MILQEFEAITKKEQALIRDGDFVLRKGFGLVSDFICAGLNEPISVTHCGLVKFEEGKCYVIHAESSDDADGMQKIPLRRFVLDSQPGTFMVTRLKAPQKKVDEVIDRVTYYLDKQVPFDHKFDSGDSTQMYCTEMIDHVFWHVFQKDYFPDKTFDGGYKLNNFLNSERFEIIVNHFDSTKTVETHLVKSDFD